MGHLVHCASLKVIVPRDSTSEMLEHLLPTLSSVVRFSNEREHIVHLILSCISELKKSAHGLVNVLLVDLGGE
jgi:hypothetical protein